MASVAIRNSTRRPAPRVPFAKVAGEVLPGWDISLIFVGEKRARDLNERLRGKTYVPNVLSYEVGMKSGEIIICLTEAERQAPHFLLPASLFVLFLFIHALLHLKGRVHGATMEQSERALLAKFSKGVVRTYPNVPSHSNRNRYRHVPGEAGRR